MNDVTNNPLDDNELEDDLSNLSELDMLKRRARMMGIEFSNNIGLDSLKKRVEEKMNETPGTVSQEASAVNALTQETEQPTPEDLANTPPAPEPEKPVKVLTLRQHLLNEATKLIRIRISCMDPKKQDLPGEFFTVSNEYIGVVRKYVPFGEATDGGWYVPACILEMLKTREFLHVKTVTHPVTKEISVKTRYVKEFAIEILPHLTKEELRRLAADQSASGRLEDRD